MPKISGKVTIWNPDGTKYEAEVTDFEYTPIPTPGEFSDLKTELESFTGKKLFPPVGGTFADIKLEQGALDLLRLFPENFDPQRMTTAPGEPDFLPEKVMAIFLDGPAKDIFVWIPSAAGRAYEVFDLAPKQTIYKADPLSPKGLLFYRLHRID